LAIANAAAREKRELLKIDPKNTTVTCSSCGHVHAKIVDLMFTCNGCGAVWDQDENSAALCAKLALSSPEKTSASLPFSS
jgi:transposase